MPDTDLEQIAVQLTICPYGDMNLVLETPAINATYLVSSHLLCSASPVFRASLGPHSQFREAAELQSSHKLYQMPIGEDLGFDPTAMAVVLCVLHGRASYIPDTIDFENLLEIAIICDYYDCAAAMSPWDKTWMQPLQKLSTESGYEDWLFLAWVFENQEVFEQMTKTFARNGVKTEDGEFGVVVRGEVKRMHTHLPECITRDMAAQHTRVSGDILRWCREIYDKYDNGTTVKCVKGSKYCDYIVFAALHTGLKALNLLEDEMYERSDGGASCTLDRAIGGVLKLINKTRRNLERISIKGSYHPDCITTSVVPESLKACMDNISCLSLTSYSKSSKQVEEPTWNTVVVENERLRIRKDDVYLEVCPYGDIEVVLSKATFNATFLVSSHALRTGSSVFRELLGPESAFAGHNRGYRALRMHAGHAESSSHAERFQLVVEKTYSPTAFAIVLYALHACGANIPSSINFNKFLKLAVVCEEYNCASVMLPWCDKWIEEWRWAVGTPGYEGWLFVAWVFGINDIFRTLTKVFAGGVIAEDCGRRVVVNEGIQKLGEYIPQRIMDEVVAQNSYAQEKIVWACQTLYEHYGNMNAQCHAYPNSSYTASLCGHFIFGGLHLGFKNAGILKNEIIEIPSTIPLISTVQDISKVLRDIAASVQIARVAGLAHSACAAVIEGVSRVVQSALDDIESLDLALFRREEQPKHLPEWRRILQEVGQATYLEALINRLHETRIMPRGPRPAAGESLRTISPYTTSPHATPRRNLH